MQIGITHYWSLNIFLSRQNRLFIFTKNNVCAVRRFGSDLKSVSVSVSRFPTLFFGQFSTDLTSTTGMSFSLRTAKLVRRALKIRHFFFFLCWFFGFFCGCVLFSLCGRRLFGCFLPWSGWVFAAAAGPWRFFDRSSTRVHYVLSMVRAWSPRTFTLDSDELFRNSRIQRVSPSCAEYTGKSWACPALRRCRCWHSTSDRYWSLTRLRISTLEIPFSVSSVSGKAFRCPDPQSWNQGIHQRMNQNVPSEWAKAHTRKSPRRRRWSVFFRQPACECHNRFQFLPYYLFGSVNISSCRGLQNACYLYIMCLPMRLNPFATTTMVRREVATPWLFSFLPWWRQFKFFPVKGPVERVGQII